jgi:hypothetical protein
MRSAGGGDAEYFAFGDEAAATLKFSDCKRCGASEVRDFARSPLVEDLGIIDFDYQRHLILKKGFAAPGSGS